MTESPYTSGVNTPGHGTIGGETDGPAGAVNTERALTPEAAEAGMNDSNARPQAIDRRPGVLA